MAQELSAGQFKQRVAEFFNQRTNYDNEGAFHPRLAARLLDYAELQPGQKVLDVATGTGLVAIAAAQQVAPHGWVVGVDLSEGMLRQAKTKIEQARLFNLSLYLQDVETLNLPDQCFDRILCSAALVYLTDIPANLKRWYHALKPNGMVGFHGFAQTAFVTSQVMQTIAQRYGIPLSLNQATGTEAACRSLLQAAGFEDITIHPQQWGRYISLAQAQATWQLNARNPLFHALQQLSPQVLEEARQAYCAELANRSTAEGIWDDITLYFAFGRKA